MEQEMPLLDDAIQLFEKETQQRVVVTEREFQNLDYGRADAIIEIGEINPKSTYIVEVKRNLTRATLGLVIQQFERLMEGGEFNKINYKRMIVTDYVNPVLANELKELDIAFLDTSGNAYVNDPPIFVFLKGNRPVKRPWGEQKLMQTFAPTRLKVLFALLCNPGLLDLPYRDIAKAADVALGTVGWVLTDLREQGYLLKTNRTRRLLRTRELTHRWVEAYPVKLRPKQIIERFQSPAQNWWQEVNIDEYKAFWGGEIAAHRLTGYLKPATATIYAHDIPNKLIFENRLRKDPKGDVEILRIFWTPTTLNQGHENWSKKPGLAPELLIYADLMATGDARNIETAKQIENEYLSKVN